MKCQILFSGKNKINTINSEFAHRVVKVNEIGCVFINMVTADTLYILVTVKDSCCLLYVV